VGGGLIGHCVSPPTVERDRRACVLLYCLPNKMMMMLTFVLMFGVHVYPVFRAVYWRRSYVTQCSAGSLIARSATLRLNSAPTSVQRAAITNGA